ncbi:uncharacterized protein KY384_001808 [Bacidia gigantensis]|uniref:uncharacterized protein n=1 Tax=Bacidia gigantensis TaxID=2732470 RepID=UPI001D0495E9|nr:uncharacterized protein KY384_001808 [Bacidia gigantensis]KAG8533025.1 hypothetical protein KY384_001808 [Bacidia gigantensis]
MAALPRPASALASKKHSMRPPMTRPGTTRAQSSAPALHSRSGAASPADSIISATTSASHSRSPGKNGGVKRKQREFDSDAGEETNINVVVRCRGRSDREVKENSGVVLQTDGVRGKNVELSMGPSALSNKTYHFDKVFAPAADQSMIYDDVVTPILDEGFNCTIFAYGQTGTGKTYTMSGDMSDTLGLVSDSAGIIPRVLHSLFRKLDADDGESSVKCSFIELYNEELRDLLSPDDSTKLKIFDDAQKKNHGATMVQGMEEAYIKTAGNGIKLLQDGSHKRQVAATKCNDLSSRSHTVFTVTAYIKRTAENGEDFVSAGKLNLVDLAGSENIQRSGAENKRAAEAGLINKSLLTLGRVINALVERNSHIPYRESKLTRLLQDSLGGRTKTCIIATVSPAKSNLEETISTLDYAFRAKNIRNKPQINQMISKKTLLKEFTTEIEKLKGELVATRQRNGVYLTAESYDDIMGESESRRILSEEQAQRIETMETSLRNKVQELFTLTNNFTFLKKDHDTTKQTLDDTKGVLDKTELVLADTKQTLTDETTLRRAYQSTEKQLQSVGGEILSTLEQTTSDISGLHSKIERKSDLQAQNCQKWQQSQNQVTDVTELVECRISEFQQQQHALVGNVSSRVHEFVQTELEQLGSSQSILREQVKSFEVSEKNVTQQTSNAKEDMNDVLEEIKELREDVKIKVGEGLNSLSAAAGRISAEVIKELGTFQLQLHTSYSSLGKDFKGIFEDLVQRMGAQKAEAEELRKQISEAATAAVQADEAVSGLLDACLNEERAKASQERQVLLNSITKLINQSAETQDARWTSRVNAVRQDISKSKTNLESSETAYCEGMHKWSKEECSLVDGVLKSRETLKTKMKEDWKAVNEHNTTIQTTTKAVHAETIRVVDEQMKDMAKQMQALDDFVTRARSQNERHHRNHLQSLQGLASDVRESYSSIGNHFTTTYDRIREVGADITEKSSVVRGILPPLDSSLKQPLADLRTQISGTDLEEYRPTGETPRKVLYHYPKSLPQSQSHDRILGRELVNPAIVSRQSLSKSPSKAMVYNDGPDNGQGSTSPSKNKDDTIGLREISLNVNAAINRNNSDSTAPILLATKSDPDFSTSMPPPLKRQATESKLPMKLRGGGMVKLEGRENLSASVGSGGVTGRRLRSSPTN